MSAINEQGVKSKDRAAVEGRRVVARAPAAAVAGRGPRFFLPGHEDGPADTERGYQSLCAQVATETTRLPRQRRIFSVSCRLKGRDCLIEVGRPLASGGTVLAIIDVGGDEPYCVRVTGSPNLRLGRRIYALTEFS